MEVTGCYPSQSLEHVVHLLDEDFRVLGGEDERRPDPDRPDPAAAAVDALAIAEQLQNLVASEKPGKSTASERAFFFFLQKWVYDATAEHVGSATYL